MLSALSMLVVGLQGPMTRDQAEFYVSNMQLLMDRPAMVAALTAKDLAPLIADPRPTWADAALGVAVRRNDRAAVPAAATRLGRGSAEIRQRAAWALGRLGGDEARRALLAHRQDGDARVRYAIGSALTLVGESSTAVPGLLDGARLGIYAAVRRLRTLRDPHAASPLYQLARTGLPDVRLESMLAASLSGSILAKNELHLWALDKSSWRKRYTAAQGLWQSKAPDDLKLVAQLREDENRYVRRAATQGK